MHKSIVKEIANRKFERNDDGGLFLPASKLNIGGVFSHWINDDKSTIQHDGNMVVDEGLVYALGTALDNQTPETNWYIGIFKNNFTVASTTTAANMTSSGMTEVIATTDVDETARQAWTGVQTSKVITNSAAPAVYTSAVASLDVYGAFLIADSTMAGTTGPLFAMAQFASSPRNLGTADEINVTYQITIADA